MDTKEPNKDITSAKREVRAKNKSPDRDKFRIAFFDIETSPNLAWVWGKWEQNVIEFDSEWHLLSFSVKWSDKPKPETWALPDFPLYHTDPENDKQLAKKLWDVLDEADMIVGHNGDKFDIRKANARFIFHGFAPPAPYKTVDTLKLARKNFAFNSNKLDDIAKHLGIGKKVKTGGFELWAQCMKGDMKAWRKMKQYNAHDVVLTEQVYNLFRAWGSSHPNITIKSGQHNACPVCASPNTILRGFRYTNASKVQSFQCKDCGKYSQAGKYERLVGDILR